VLTLSQKSSVRRHLMYPIAGLYKTSAGGNTLMSGAAGWRFSEAAGFLEYKMNNMNPDEEARLLGYAFGSVDFVGNPPNVGDTATVVLFGGNLGSNIVTLVTTVSSAPTSNTDARLAACQDLASQAGQSSTLAQAGIYAVAPYGVGPFSESKVPLPEVAFVSPVVFSITATATGLLAAQQRNVPELLPPFATLTPGDSQQTKVIYGYLNILDALEAAHAQTSENLDTFKADVWTGRSNEIGLRTSLYRHWQVMLSDFLGTPINQKRRNSDRGHGAMSYA